MHTGVCTPATQRAAARLRVPRVPSCGPHNVPHRSLQVTSPVLWENTLQTLFDKGLTRSYELGPGKVVAGIAKRIKKDHDIANIIA